MRFSAPLHRLKQQARALARREGIPLHRALDRVAQREGVARWSLLVAQASADPSPRQLLEGLSPGELVLVAARPRQGKTLLCVRVALAALRAGRQAGFFSLVSSEVDLDALFAAAGADRADWPRFRFDNAASTSAASVIAAMGDAKAGDVVVVDYLQALDRCRAHPPAGEQVAALRAFARRTGAIVLLLSQILPTWREGEPPSVADVSLPNPLDTGLFSRSWFLHAGQFSRGE